MIIGKTHPTIYSMDTFSIVKLSIESESNYKAIKFCELSKPQQEIAELNLFIASLADLED